MELNSARTILIFSLIDDGTASVVGEFTMNMQRHWTCPRCQAGMVVSVTERLEHEAMCQSQNITGMLMLFILKTFKLYSSTIIGILVITICKTF